MTYTSRMVWFRGVTVVAIVTWVLSASPSFVRAEPGERETAEGLSAPRPAQAASEPAPSTNDTDETRHRGAPAEQQLDEVPPPPEGEYDRPPGYGEGTSGKDAASKQEGRYPSPTGVDEGRTGEAGVRIPSGKATRLRVLNADLSTLASRGGSSIVDGVLSILSGGLLVTLGVLIEDDDRGTSSYMYVWGGANVARGVIELTLVPDAEEAAITFSHMPMNSAEQVQERLDYGESQLARIAHRSRLTRILDASINLGVGLAVIPVYLGPQDFQVDEPFDYFVLIGSGISIISGLVNLFTWTEAEKRWAAYKRVRERVEEQGSSQSKGGDHATPDSAQSLRDPDEGPTFGFGATPTPNGGAAVFQARF